MLLMLLMQWNFYKHYQVSSGLLLQKFRYSAFNFYGIFHLISFGKIIYKLLDYSTVWISEMSMTRYPLQCPPVLGSCTPKWLPIYAHIRLFDNYQMKWPNVISPSDLGIGRSILGLRWF